MSAKKRSYKPNSFLSCGGDHDKFSPIYESMLKHDEFKLLTLGERMMFIYCAVQVNAQDSKQQLYMHCKAEGTEVFKHYFTFPASKMKEYGIDQATGSRQLTKLCKHGFIECIEQNKHRRTANVYALSDKWKKYGV